MKLLPPLSTAGTRTKKALFTPFEIGKWFVLGFTAWLANFLTGMNSGGANFPIDLFLPDQKSQDSSSIAPAADFWAACWSGDWFAAASAGPGFSSGASVVHPVAWPGFVASSLPDWSVTTWVLIVGAAVGVFCVLVALFVWLGCRGWFMFLDNVVHDRALIKAPWKEFSTHANSLFLFYLAMTGVMLLACVIFAVPAYFAFPQGSGHDWTAYIPLIILGSALVLFVLALGFVSFFTLEFGTLWMYRHGGSAWEAMWKVGQLATQYPLPFIGYFLLRFVMNILFIICGLLLGCLTCCLGFFPYLNAVLNLPFSVYRGWYTIECFAQLGEEYDVRVPSLVLPPAPLPPPAS